MKDSEISLCALCATDISVLVSDGDRGGELVLYQCCGKFVCKPCREVHPRLEKYCPFCQTMTRDIDDDIGKSSAFQLCPPQYDLPMGYDDDDDDDVGDYLPSYQDSQNQRRQQIMDEKSNSNKRGDGILHYISLNDSVHSLSLKYGVDMDTIRRRNKIYADHLIVGMTAVWIPMTSIQLEEYHQRVGTSQPIITQTIEQQLKVLLKRFQLSTKCIDYDIAKVYMDQADWNLNSAITQYKQDEEWEKIHPTASGDNHHHIKMKPAQKKRSLSSRIFNH